LGITHFDSLSVISGLYIGAKDSEHLAYNGGKVSFSGWFKSFDSGLGTITAAQATVYVPAAGLTVQNSGATNIVMVSWSGGIIDLNALCAISGASATGTLTSSGTSSIISWFAIGT
jgi:hypothetical protein